jgi:hypothetical protein
MRRVLLLLAAAALALAACNTVPNPYNNPLPADGPILYTCADGTQLTVDFESGGARVAIIGGRSFVLPQVGADYYANGRYALRGGGRDATWETAGALVNCRGA